MTDHNINPEEVPDWYKQKPSKDTKDYWKDTLANYIDARELDVNKMAFSVELVKDLIPYISFQDKNWKHFKRENFNSGKYPMHEHLYNAVRNKLDSMQTDKEKVSKKSSP